MLYITMVYVYAGVVTRTLQNLLLVSNYKELLYFLNLAINLPELVLTCLNLSKLTSTFHKVSIWFSYGFHIVFL